MIDFIQGNKFKGLTNIHYAPLQGPMPDNYFWESVNNIPLGDYRHLKNTMDIKTLKDGDIIYTHTFYADQLFNAIKELEIRLVVITHNCDTTMPINPPDNVIGWFTQNVSIVNLRVESIPLGIENDRWLIIGHKDRKMLAKRQQSRNYRGLVYMNHNVSNNPTQRLRPYQLLENKPWVTSKKG